MPENPRRANSTRRNAIRKRWKSMGMPCAICGKPIDYDAPYYLNVNGRRMVNREAFVVDEIVPVRLGGDPLDFSNTQPAHFRCNAWKGGRMLGDETNPPPTGLEQPWDWG